MGHTPGPWKIGNQGTAYPDLLEAAKTLMENALDRDECHDEDTGEMFEDWEALQKAIDKAEGR